jgi:hypothetical protein
MPPSTCSSDRILEPTGFPVIRSHITASLAVFDRKRLGAHPILGAANSEQSLRSPRRSECLQIAHPALSVDEFVRSSLRPGAS